MHGWLILSSACFGLALAVTLLALRGRCVDDHPICRRCGFDLFGKPAESTVCSECGADLARRKAVRVGRRERRGRVLSVAVPVLLLSAGWSGWDGWRQARAVDWNSRKPVWWLVREANGQNPAARDAALMELARRIAAGRLPREREDALVARALDVQADTTRPWSPAWGTVVEAAHDTGGLSDPQWLRYMCQAIGPTLSRAATPARAGERVEFLVGSVSPRIATTKVTRGMAADAFHIGVYAGPKLLVDGQALDIEEGSIANGDARRRMTHEEQLIAAVLSQRNGGYGPPANAAGVGLVVAMSWAGPLRPTYFGYGATLHTREPLPATLKEGRHTATLRVQLVPLHSVWDGPGSTHFEPLGPALVTELQTAWSLLPGVRVNPDPSFRAGVERSLRVERVVFRTDRPLPALTGSLSYRGTPPIGLAYRVFIIEGGRALSAGSASFAAGASSPAAVFSAPVAGFDFRRLPRTVAIELRPAPDLAGPGVKEVWSGEVTLDNIPLEVFDATRTSPGGKEGR